MCIAMTIIGKVFQACYLIEGKPLKSKIFLGIGWCGTVVSDGRCSLKNVPSQMWIN